MSQQATVEQSTPRRGAPEQSRGAPEQSRGTPEQSRGAPEQSRECTLTAPEDRNRNVPFRLDVTAPPLSRPELDQAVRELSNNSLIKKFPRIERRFEDPPIDMQKIGLISFIPAKGATPNEKGIFGFAKLRGNFATEIEARAQAERIIHSVDSYHKIFHAYVGRPFPLTVSSDFSADIDRVELKKQTSDSFSEDIKKKRLDEQREIKEIKEREKALLEDVKKAPEENHQDYYTTLRVKKAQLSWIYLETERKLKEMRGSIAKVRREIEQYDEKEPELKELYYKKYLEAREHAGLPIDRVTADTSFMKYMVEDVSIPAVDEEYRRLYGERSEPKADRSSVEHPGDCERSEPQVPVQHDTENEEDCMCGDCREI